MAGDSVKRKDRPRVRSSAGQSSRLITGRSQVRYLPDPPSVNEKRQLSMKCKGFRKRDGMPCKAEAGDKGREFCCQHDPAREDVRTGHRISAQRAWVIRKKRRDN